MSFFYSFIVPVFNRPGELDELLKSLVNQDFRNFELVVIEDGSQQKSDHLIASYSESLDIQYPDHPKSGPSLARNAGTQAARGDYYIYVDSDCILPPDYLSKVDAFLRDHPLDFFGGPDRASADFNRTQQAISYAMTSFLTTGGIRGGKKKVDRFYPRSFNMGISRKAFAAIGGFPDTRMHPGEDMVLSIELIRAGFASGLIPDAYVYHKRRTSLQKFFRQVAGFGKTRVIISKVYPDTFSVFFLAPAVFLLGSAGLLLATVVQNPLFLLPIACWMLLVVADATLRTRSLITGIVAVIASFIQLYGYGWGFLTAWWRVAVLQKDEYGVLSTGFYPGREARSPASSSFPQPLQD